MALRVLIGAALFIWAVPSSIRAAQFDVNPVEAVLSAGNHSQLLTVRNNSAETIRLQVSAFRWQEGANGKPLLSATDDIIAFPELFSLSPGESRKIRVGSLTPLEQTEKTYRLYVSQLKPLQTRVTPVTSAGPQIIVLLNIGIPIFIEPITPSFRGEVSKLTMMNGILSFEVRNTGNLHFAVRKLLVQGMAADGRTVFAREAQGSRVLAGNAREYQLPPLAATECSSAQVIEVEADTDHGVLHSSLPVSAGACSGAKSPGAQR